MRIELGPTDVLEVCLEDTDGTLTVDARHDALKVSIDTEDDKQRTGILYHETFRREFNDEVVRSAQCVECGQPFDITVGAIDFMKNLYGEKYRDPVRCKPCRTRRKQIAL